MNAAVVEGGAAPDADVDMFAEVPTAGPLVSSLEAMEAEAEAGAAGAGAADEEDEARSAPRGYFSHLLRVSSRCGAAS